MAVFVLSDVMWLVSSSVMSRSMAVDVLKFGKFISIALAVIIRKW